MSDSKVKECIFFSIYCAFICSLIGCYLKDGFFIWLLCFFIFYVFFVVTVSFYIFIRKVVKFLYENYIKVIVDVASEEKRNEERRNRRIEKDAERK